MNTFNLGLAVGDKADLCGAHIIVCASEDPIDAYEVTMVAAENLPAALSRNRDPQVAIKEVAKAIKQRCGCEAVVVSSDALLQIVAVRQPPSPSA